MRNTIIASGLSSILLFAMSSCMTDVSNDTNDQEVTSDQALDDEAPGASSRLSQTSGRDLNGGQLDLRKGEPSALTCGLQGPYAGAGGWWKYGISNCNPYTIRAQVFRINGSGGPCFTIAPGQTVWDWIQGNLVGIRGC